MSSRNCSKPIRIWIDGQSYDTKKLDKNILYQQKFVRNTQQISRNTNTNYHSTISTKFRIPKFYYSKFDGLGYDFIRKLENDTNTSIVYPRKGKEGEVEISGDSEQLIAKARDEIHSLIAGIREKQEAKQFTLIRLQSDDIQNKFEEFKKHVLAENHQGVEESIFQKGIKLHLTVNVFCLMDDRELQVAIDTLKECKNSLFGHGSSRPMKIKVQGVHSMNENESKVHVLYANAMLTEDSSSNMSLQEILNTIQNSFYEKGLVKGYQDNVKVHMTLMNTKYRNKEENSPNKKRWVKKVPFDATKIIEKFKDYEFGEVLFDTIFLSSIHEKDDEGFYKTIAAITF